FGEPIRHTEYEVVSIPEGRAREFVVTHHYSGTYPDLEHILTFFIPEHPSSGEQALIEIPRALARQFRVLLRRCTTSRALRGTGPLVGVRASPEGLTMWSCLDEAALRFHQAGSRPPDMLAFHAEVLARIEGRDNNPVCLERLEEKRGRARWQER